MWKEEGGISTSRPLFNIPTSIAQGRSGRQISLNGKLTSKTGVDVVFVLDGYWNCNSILYIPLQKLGAKVQHGIEKSVGTLEHKIILYFV